MDVTTESIFGSLIGIVAVALAGLIVGALAKWFMPGKDPGGIFATILLGVAGSFIGAGIGHLLGLKNWAFALAIFGAMLLLLVYRQFRGAR